MRIDDRHLHSAPGLDIERDPEPLRVQIGVQGLMIIAAVALSIDRKLMRIVK